MGIHDRGNGAVVYMAMTFGDVFDRCDGLFFCFVSEHGAEGAVADDADVREFGAVLLVYDQTALVVDIEPNIFEAQAGGVGSAANGYQDDVGIELGRVRISSIYTPLHCHSQSPFCHLWQPRLRA